MRGAPTYIKTVRKRLPAGETRIYRYHSKTGRPIEGEPGTAEFDASLRAAAVALPDRSFERYRRNVLYELKARFALMRSAAATRGLAFAVTVDDLAGVLGAQGWVCALSGLRFALRPYPATGTRSHPLQLSIDRIDVRRGYEGGNVRAVCLAVNIALGEWGDQVLLQIAAAIADRARSTTSGERREA